jgi:hypothetical protein
MAAASCEQEEWLSAVGRLLRAPYDPARVERCPNCEVGTLQLRLILYDPHTRRGWGAVWCDHCHRGMHLSRLEVPAGAPALSSDEAERLGTGIPDFEPVDCDPSG